MKTVLSGIQPSGNFHIGNLYGAINQWVRMQNEYDIIAMVADLHAITIPQDPKKLQEKIKEVVALNLAAGIDPNKSHIFIQSENPDHTYLAWILNTITSFGQLERMTQFKEKSQKHEENVGLFDYPVLMAADILLYQTDEVPVGEDQKQHLELARDLAEKFNSRFGEVFKIPAAYIVNETARIMSLQNPEMKMSKSDSNPLGAINLLDSEEEIRGKIKKAVTDSSSSISRNAGSAAISNLLTIYASFNNQTLDQVYSELEGKSYGEFKNLLADVVVKKLLEIQKRYQEIREDEQALRKILDQGRDYAISKSSQTLLEVKEKVGLV
ncbi:MAG: tryptophan--tRNA ligase [Candidatus Levybacteria bacterium]|nr:tryptophan--tRNA ligase [Candidatus Levybacteria bacterium]